MCEHQFWPCYHLCGLHREECYEMPRAKEGKESGFQWRERLQCIMNQEWNLVSLDLDIGKLRHWEPSLNLPWSLAESCFLELRKVGGNTYRCVS